MSTTPSTATAPSTPFGWTAKNTPGEPAYFVVRDANGSVVGSLLANSADQAIADLYADMQRRRHPSRPSALDS